MTTDHEMAKLYADQEKVIAALHSLGEPDLPVRLECCAAARRERHHGDGWPRICRSIACAWCRRPIDPFVVGWVLRLDNGNRNFEPCRNTDRFVSRFA